MLDPLPEPFVPESTAIREHLAALKGKRIMVLINPGNRGDGLIHAGARQLFGSLDLDFREFRFPEPASGDELLVHVPGNLNRTDNQMIDQINFYRRNFSRITILPCTVDWRSGRSIRFLRGLEPDRFTVFARERTTFAGLKERCPGLRRVFLSHDLAFHFDYAPWTRIVPQTGRTLAILRQDLEQGLSQKIQADHVEDLSRGGSVGFEKLLEGIAPFETVYSDRTHGAIAAALMGRRTIILDSSYHKNRSIFEFSLSRLPNIALQAPAAPPAVNAAKRFKVWKQSVRAHLRPLAYWMRHGRSAARLD